MQPSQIPTTKFTPETASELGRRGGKASAKARRKVKDLDWLRTKAGVLLPDLVAAAQGTGRFESLPPSEQLKALLKVMEFGLGKPTTAQRPEAPTEAPGLVME